MRYERIPQVMAASLIIALGAIEGAEARLLFHDDFESTEDLGTDSDSSWTIQPESASARVPDPANAFDRVLSISRPDATATRSFPPVTAEDPAPVLDLQLRFRIDAPSPADEFVFELGSSSSGIEPLRLSLRPDGPEATRGLTAHGRMQASEGAGAPPLSVIREIRGAEWYQLRVRADLVSRAYSVDARNLRGDDPGQSGRVPFRPLLPDGLAQLDRLTVSVGGDSSGRISIDDVQATVHSASDVLRFGDFEQSTGGAPLGWRTESREQLAVENRTPLSGRGSLALFRRTEKRGAKLQLEEPVRISDGNDYRLRFQMRIDERDLPPGNALEVRIHFLDEANQPVGDVFAVNGHARAPGPEWYVQEWNLRPPPGAHRARVELATRYYGSLPDKTFTGKLSIDEMQLIRLPRLAFNRPAETLAFDFVEAGGEATPGFDPVAMDQAYEPGAPGARGFLFEGDELRPSQRSSHPSAYPSLLQSHAVRNTTFSVAIPPGDYRVSLYAGTLRRVPLKTYRNDFRVNRQPVADPPRDRDALMDEEYFRYVHDAGVDRDSLVRGADEVYDDYVGRRFPRLDVDVAAASGELQIEIRQGFVGGVVVTPLAHAAEHDAAVEAFDRALRQNFAHRWAEPLPTNSARGARRGDYQPDPETPYVLYQRPWMEAVEHDSRPGGSDLLKKLEVVATPGEYEPTTFSIWPRRRLEDVRVSTSDLRGPNGASLPASAIRVWALVPKPLRLDRPASGFRIEGMLLPDWHDAEGRGRTLHRDMVQRVWLSVRVPGEAQPGVYEGTLSLSPSGDDRSATSIPFSLRVRPFSLLRPKRLHSLRRAGNEVLVPYPDTYTPERPGPAAYAAVGSNASDSRTKQFYRKAALEDLLAHGFVPEFATHWPSVFDPETGELAWDREESLKGRRSQIAQLLRDSPAGATGELFLDGSNAGRLLLSAFDSGYPKKDKWSRDTVARFLTALYRDLGPQSARQFGGYRRVYFHATAEESHYSETGFEAWLAYLEFVRRGDAEHAPQTWGNDPARPDQNFIFTTHTLNTNRGHRAAVPDGLVDWIYLGMAHSVSDPGGRQQIRDAVEASSPFGMYGIRGRYTIGYYHWRAGASGAYHEFYNPLYGTPNDDWDNPMSGKWGGGHAYTEIPGWFQATYSPTGRMVSNWHWEEVREGVDDEAYLTTLGHWVEASECAGEAATQARTAGQALLDQLTAAIDLDIDLGHAATLTKKNYLYRPIDLATFDVWRSRVASAVEALVASAPCAMPSGE